jgi:hypothetical protein
LGAQKHDGGNGDHLETRGGKSPWAHDGPAKG